MVDPLVKVMRAVFLTFVLLFCPTALSAQGAPFQTGHTNDILEVKFSPDDTQLISYSAGDGWLCLWEVRSGRLLWKTKTGFVQKADEYYKLQEFYWSEDKKFIVTKSANGTYQMWDATAGKILRLSGRAPDIRLISEKAKKFSVTKDYGSFYLSPSGSNDRFTIKSFSRTGDVYDVSYGGDLFAEGGSWGDAAIKITEVRTGMNRFLSGHPGVVKTIAFSPEGGYLAVGGSDKNIYILDAATHALLRTLAGHTEPVSSIAFSPDGKALLSSSEDELMKLWDWREGRSLQDIKSEADMFGVQRVAFSPDGKYFLTTSDRPEFRLWDARTLKLVRNFKTEEKYESTSGNMTIGYNSVPVSSAAFIEGGKKILSSHADGSLRIWDADSGRQLKRFKSGKPIPFFQVIPDGKRIIAATNKGEELQLELYNAEDGKELIKFDDEHTAHIESLSVSPDGKHFATSDVSGDVLLWDVSKTKPVRELDIGFSGDDAIAFSPDGKTLAVGGRNQNLFLFDVETGRKLWQLIPSYQPSDLEVRLTKEKELRQAELKEAKERRVRQAAVDTAGYKKQVYITFEHYGDMTDPGELRMAETGEPKKSKVRKAEKDANAVWLRIRNDSPLPVSIPTQSIYLPNPNCFHRLPNGQKVLGLCDNREISIWFGLEDKGGEQVPYGVDFGSSAILLPGTSALFAVPRNALRGGNAIRFDYTFQKEAGENKVEDYGEAITLRFRESDIPRSQQKTPHTDTVPRKNASTPARPPSR